MDGKHKMRAMTTKLPWAWLIVNGFKRYELQHGRANIRERVAIRASTLNRNRVDGVRRDFPHIPLPSDAELRSMQRCILGTPGVSDCRPIEELADARAGACVEPGDYEFAWILDAPEPLEEPLAWTPPSGAVIWSILTAGMERRVRQIGSETP